MKEKCKKQQKKINKQRQKRVRGIEAIVKGFLISDNVTSLLTNIPLQETIDIATNLIFKHNPNLNITRKELKTFFATSQPHLIFNSKFYNQIEGVSMGSPLAPVLANIFMGFHESK